MTSKRLSINEKFLFTLKGKKGKIFDSGEIKDMILAKYPNTNRRSLMPPDYCYNKTNKGNNLTFPFPLFEVLDNNLYKYLGLNFKYNGKAFWKGNLTGVWKKGIYTELILGKK